MFNKIFIYSFYLFTAVEIPTIILRTKEINQKYNQFELLVHSKYQTGMDKLLLMENLRTNLFLIFIVSTVASPLVEKFEKLNFRCDINNTKYWDLIDWYFERTTHLVSTTISEGHREKQDFSTVFLMQLTKCE